MNKFLSVVLYVLWIPSMYLLFYITQHHSDNWHYYPNVIIIVVTILASILYTSLEAYTTLREVL